MKYLFALSLLFLASNCGKAPSSALCAVQVAVVNNALTSFTPGNTNQAQVEAALGTPISTTTYTNGSADYAVLSYVIWQDASHQCGCGTEDIAISPDGLYAFPYQSITYNTSTGGCIYTPATIPSN